MIALLAFLQLKHFVLDFPLQTPFMFRNKGKYGHPGGILHAGLHALATLPAVMVIAPGLWWLAAAEFLVHYHMDWAKVQINERTRWGPTTHPQFWTLLGFDQLVHQLTYVWIAYVALGGSQ